MCFSRRRLHFVLAALLVRGLLLDSGSISSRPTASAQTLAEESDAEYQSESDREPAATPAPKKKASASQAGKWRSPGASISKNSLTKPGDAADHAARSDHGQGGLEPLATAPHHLAQVSESLDALPNEAGQILRTYNIRPYTVRVTSTNRPEQAIVDWILRETGYEAWHSEPVALLCANASTLIVYHTPEMHKIVAEVVDRFVSSEAESQAFGLRVVTVGHPDWRAKAHAVLHPVPVQTQGIQAWLVHKEDVALMLEDMRKRNDFREHSSPHLLVNNGQSTTVSSIRPRTFVRDVFIRPEIWPGFEPEQTQFDEGFSLELSPLLSLDGQTVDSVIKCNIDQLEKLVPVTLAVPTAVAPRQRVPIEVPQVTHCRLHERFRWPAGQVLVVGLGVVATPVPEKPNALMAALPILSQPARADLLVFVESKGQAAPAREAVRSSARDAKTYHGRY